MGNATLFKGNRFNAVIIALKPKPIRFDIYKVFLSTVGLVYYEKLFTIYFLANKQLPYQPPRQLSCKHI